MSTIEELLKPCRVCCGQAFQQTPVANHFKRRYKRQEHVAYASKQEDTVVNLDRRTALLSKAAAATVILSREGPCRADEITVTPDTTITDKVYLDVGLCQQNSLNRTLGDNAFCSQPEGLGRIILGLYGNLVPTTVHNFLELMKAGTYNNTLFNKVLPGEYIAAGKQGSARLGEVALTADLQPNKDLMAARSYDLNHQRAGTVSLNLSRSDDDPMVQQGRAYRNVSFLITTGPGPASSLDGTNVVFGKVLQGMDTVARVTSVPTFKPVNDRLLALNRLGAMLGDERADKTRKKWGRPLKPILITDTGILS